MPNKSKDNNKEKNVIIVDGANVAWLEKDKQDKPKVNNIKKILKKLKEKGFNPVVLVDASFKYDVDKPDEFEKMLDGENIKQVPAGTDADYFILEFAKEKDAKILTNDQYENYQKKYPKFEKKQVTVMVIDDSIVFHNLEKTKNSSEEDN